MLFVLLFVVHSYYMEAQQWQSIGPTGSPQYSGAPFRNGTGQIHCIAFHPNFPNTNVIFAGTPYGGLWRSTDGGQNWYYVPLKLANGQQIEVNSVNEITVTNFNGNTTIYIATGSSNKHGRGEEFVPSCGIYKSNNLGQSFYPVGSFNSLNGGFTYDKQKLTTKIAIHPTDSNIIFVASSDGLYRTTNGGSTWQLVLTENEPEANFSTTWNEPKVPGIWNVQFSPNNTQRVYASGLNIYRSESTGSSGTFNTMPINHFDAFFNIPPQPGFPSSANLIQRNFNFKVVNNSGTDNIYCTAHAKYDSAKYRVYYYDGIDWTTCGTTDLLNQSFMDSGTVDRLKLDVRPGFPQTVITGVTETRISNDYGNNWATLTGYNTNAHADIHEVKYAPDGTFALIGTDGGIFRYDVASGSITETNNGLSVSTIWDMSVSPLKKNYVAIGKQDTGYDWFDGNTWTKDLSFCGDGYPPVAFDLHRPSKFFVDCNFNLREIDVDASTQATVNAGCVTNSVASPVQHPLPQYQKRYFCFKAGQGQLKIFYTENNNYGRYYDYLTDLSGDPDLHSFKKLRIAKSDPFKAYIFTNSYGFWYNSRLFKLHLNEFSLSSYDSDCSNSIPCNNPTTSCRNDLRHLAPNCINFFPVSDIAISSKNPNHLWLAIKYDDKMLATPQYTSNCNLGYKYRVRKTTNGGLTPSDWQNDDAGLPQYPITHIIYVDGSNDALFCATANGRVFYKNGTMSAWIEVDANLPRTAITKMDINYCTNRLYVSTYGKGVYYLDLTTYTPHRNQVLEINSNTTWTSEYYDIGSDIVVKAGNTLTINAPALGAIVNMCKDCKITIERGAKLNAYNTTFTNSCGETWYGIEVLGNTARRQVHIDSLIVFTGDQGVCLLNNCKLEYMQQGVLMSFIQNGSHVFGWGGGQLVAQYTQFINNTRSVQFGPYFPPTDPGNPLGHFKSKLFKNSFNNTTIGLDYHLTLFLMRGLPVEGCVFDNNTSWQTYPHHLRGIGIYAATADFTVLRPLDQTPNEFKNMAYGVRIDGGPTNYPNGNNLGTRINKATFINNKYGIYISGSMFARITENTFSVPGISGCPVGSTGCNLQSYGIYAHGCSGFKIQENSLTTTGTIATQILTHGIVVNNTTAQNEIVRRNTLTNFRYGLVAVGRNSNQPTSNPATGLEFRCNTLNTSRSFDIWVAEDVVNGNVTLGSVRQTQGDVCIPQTNYTIYANNRFNQLSNSVPTRQLARNQQTYGYTYYSPTSDVNSVYWPKRIQTNYPITRVGCFPISNFNFDQICPNEIVPSDYQPSLINQWNNQMLALLNLIDGGDKTALLDGLQQATPFNIEEVYEELIQKDAISEDVLLKAIENPYADYAPIELKALIIKNSGLSDSVVDVLLQRQLPYSQQDVWDMEMAQQQLSPEEQIKAEVAAKQREVEEHLQAWSLQYASVGDVDSALLMLTLFENESILSRLALSALHWGRPILAKQTAAKLNDIYLKQYIELQDTLQSFMGWLSADTAVLEKLWQIYSHGGLAGVLAQNALALTQDTLIEAYLPAEDVAYRYAEPENKWKKMRTVQSNIFAVRPNPAHQELNIYLGSEHPGDIVLTLADANGKPLWHHTAERNGKPMRIDVANYASGFYLLKATTAQGEFYVQKVIIKH